MNRLFAPGLLAVAFLTCGAARAEVFHLREGGQIEGELLNPNQSPRETYVIKTTSGTVTLARAQIKEIIRLRPVEEEYEKVRPRYADTVDGQWRLSEWCRERSLGPQRRKHLERVIELDPNHAQARHALGYSQVDGHWATQKEAMAEQGLERYKGQYRTKQEIEILEQKRKRELDEKAWIQKIERWQVWLRGDRARIAQEEIEKISEKEPLAVKGLAQGVHNNPNPHVRILLSNALARIGTQQADRALAFYAMEDPEEEVRLSCLDHLRAKKNPAAVDSFVGYLRNKDNLMVNRAGVALKQIEDPSAIGPLIDALVTTHKFKIQGPPPGQTTNSFGTGPGGSAGPMSMSFGGNGPKTFYQPIQNRAVLDALAAITGVNYGFDVRAWKSWYAMQRKRETPRAGLERRAE